jgi:hypothetical protein
LTEASPATVDVWVAPDSGHTEGFAKHPQEWEHQVIVFLDEHLA